MYTRALRLGRGREGSYDRSVLRSLRFGLGLLVKFEEGKIGVGNYSGGEREVEVEEEGRRV